MPDTSIAKDNTLVLEHVSDDDSTSEVIFAPPGGKRRVLPNKPRAGDDLPTKEIGRYEISVTRNGGGPVTIRVEGPTASVSPVERTGEPAIVTYRVH